MRQILAILCCAATLHATTYYVDNVSGNNSNNGTSTGTAWATIAHANATVAANDTILLKRGDVFREVNTVPQSGLTYGNYGTGALPQINGATLVTGWSEATAQKYVYLTSSTSTTVPSDWNNSSNTVDVYGPGGNGHDGNGSSNAGAAGGSGGYSRSTNVTLPAGSPVNYAIGLASGSDGGNGTGPTYFCNLTTGCTSETDSAVVAAANAGTGATNNSVGGVGANTTNAKGTTTTAAGCQGGSSTSDGGGAAGSPGPNGACTTGGVGASGTGGGGGGADGGSNGVSGAVTGNGGNNHSMSGGGTQLSRNGANGGGGAGGTGTAGGNGSVDSTYGDLTHGPGSGPGGGQGSFNGGTASGFGCGGAGSGGSSSSYGTACPGGIVLSYVALNPNVWSATVSTQPNWVWFNGILGTQVSGTNGLIANGDWYWNSNTLYVYSPSGSGPTVDYTSPGIEAASITNPVNVTAHQNVTLTGLDILHGNSSGIYGGNLSGFMLTNSLIESNYGNCVEIDDTVNALSNVTISNNVLQNCGASGIETDISQTGSGWVISNNSILNVSQVIINSSLWQFSGGMDFFCAGANNNVLISGNRVINAGNGQVINGYVQGIGIWVDTCNGAHVTRNYVTNSTSSGIMLEKNIGTLADYNISENNDTCTNLSNTCGGNFLIRADLATSTSNVTLDHNTSYGGQAGIVAYWDQTGGAGSTFCNNLIVTNNIAVGATRNLNIGYGCDNDGVNGSGNVYTNNAFGVQGTGFVYWQSSGALNTYSALNTAYGSAMNNVTTDPVLTNTTSGDVRPGRGTAVLTGSTTGGIIGALGAVEPSLLIGVGTASGAVVIQ